MLRILPITVTNFKQKKVSFRLLMVYKKTVIDFFFQIVCTIRIDIVSI